MRTLQIPGRQVLALVPLGLAALLLGACGGSDGPRGDANADPATIVPRTAAIAATAAEDRLRRRGVLRRGGSYRGVAYELTRRDHTPTALVGDFLVGATSIGTLRAVVDAWRGSSLAESARYRAT